MQNNLLSTGLSPETIGKIRQVFRSYPQIERVCLYGSRAKGNFNPGSDIDLTIMGEGLTSLQLPGLENALDDLLLPYKIDLCLFRQIMNNELVEHIRRVGVDFYRLDS